LKINQSGAARGQIQAQKKAVEKIRKYVFPSMNRIGILRSSVGGGTGDNENHLGL